MVNSGNNVETTRRDGGITGRGFRKGQSGNPNGRPKSLASLIREETGDGTEIVLFVLDVFRGRHGASLRARLDAATWLADRAYGRPVPASKLSDLDVPISVVSFDLRKLEAPDLALLEAITEKASGDSLGPSR